MEKKGRSKRTTRKIQLQHVQNELIALQNQMQEMNGRVGPLEHQVKLFETFLLQHKRKPRMKRVSRHQRDFTVPSASIVASSSKPLVVSASKPIVIQHPWVTPDSSPKIDVTAPKNEINKVEGTPTTAEPTMMGSIMDSMKVPDAVSNMSMPAIPQISMPDMTSFSSKEKPANIETKK